MTTILKHIKKLTLIVFASAVFQSSVAQPPSWMSVYDLQCFVHNALLSKQSIPKNISELLDDRDVKCASRCVDGHNLGYHRNGYNIVRRYLQRNIESVRIQTNENYDTEFYWKGEHLFTATCYVEMSRIQEIEFVFHCGDTVFFSIDQPDTTENQVFGLFAKTISDECKKYLFEHDNVIYTTFDNDSDVWEYDLINGLMSKGIIERKNKYLIDFIELMEKECELFCKEYSISKIRFFSCHFARSPYDGMDRQIVSDELKKEH